MIITGISPSAPASHHSDGRRLLREIAKRFAGTEIGEIITDKGGKPRTDGFPFSISHSSGLVMCSVFVSGEFPSLPVLADGDEIAVAGDVFFASDAWECADIGADIEIISDSRKEERIRALAERYYSEAEREFVLGGDTAERFYRVWTEKESFLKLTGEGLSGIRRADTSSLPQGTFCRSFRVIHGGEKYSASICQRGR